MQFPGFDIDSKFFGFLNYYKISILMIFCVAIEIEKSFVHFIVRGFETWVITHKLQVNMLDVRTCTERIKQIAMNSEAGG